MGFWLPAIGLLLICLLFLWSAFDTETPKAGTASDADHARLFYERQLEALSSDRSARNLDEDAYAAAKVELDREFLRQSQEWSKATGGFGFGSSVRVVPIFLTATISLGLYMIQGSPTLNNAPLASRIAAGENLDIEQVIERVEAYLQVNPEELRGWRVIAPVYMRQGQFEKASNAFGRIVELENATADNLTDLAEARLSLEQGEANLTTIAVLERAAGLDPSHVRSRFYLAGVATDAGNYEEAAARWEELLALANGDEPWVETAMAGLRRATEGVDGWTAGPSQADIESAARLSDADRQAMIEQMVEGLRKRLDSSGGRPAEWAQLLRAEIALNEIVNARRVLRLAREQFADDVSLKKEFEMLAADDIRKLENY